MNRIFGGGRNAKPKMTINDAIASTDTQVDALSVKIRKLEAELGAHQQKLARMRDGPGKQAVKQKALSVLRQKKMYEARMETLQQQAFNMEQANMTTENMRNTMATFSAMKQSAKEMKREYRNINIDKIERLQDEMEEYMDAANEMSAVLGRDSGYAVDVDEEELDAELEALGDEFNAEEAFGEPSYLTSDVPQGLPEFVDDTTTTEPAAADKIGTAAQ